jgi:putative oxidoreductase
MVDMQMRTLFRHPVLLFVVRWFLGLVFIIAGIEKIAQPELYAISIEAYKLLPLFSVNIFALVVPWVELICGVFLLGGVCLRGSALMLIVLLAVFIVAIAAALMRGLQIDCGCFGAQYSSPVGMSKIAEDVGLFVLALLIYLTAGAETLKTAGTGPDNSPAPLHSA